MPRERERESGWSVGQRRRPSILVERIRAHCTAARPYLGRSISGKSVPPMIAIDACVLPVASAWLRTKARLVPSYRIYVYTIHVIRTRSTHVTPDRKTGYYDSNRWMERIKLVENNLSEIISISLLSPSNYIRSIENSSFRFFYLRSILTDRPTDSRCDEETE